MRNLIVVLILFLFASTALGQVNRIQGWTKHALSKKYIVGVIVNIPKYNISTASDKMGQFEIEIDGDISIYDFLLSEFELVDVVVDDSGKYTLFISKIDDFFDLSIQQLLKIRVKPTR